MRDDTLVIWGEEFDRLSTAQTGTSKPGRDHNPHCFTAWMAGGRNTLSEDRVRRVSLPMLAGSEDWDYSLRDLEYIRDLGLVARAGEVQIANPIYAEVVPRELTAALQSGLETQVNAAWYVNADGSLDVAGLLAGFQCYFREHAESWVERNGHAEAGPQLVLHAYLQRVVNSGGRIEREYAVGRGRTDLLIEWQRVRLGGRVHTRKYVIECKVRRAGVGFDRLIREGLEQTAAYMDGCGAESGHLLIFDVRPGQPWEDRLYRKDPEQDGHPITIWGIKPSRHNDGSNGGPRRQAPPALRHSHVNGRLYDGFKLHGKACAGCILAGPAGTGRPSIMADYTWAAVCLSRCERTHAERLQQARTRVRSE